MRNYPTLLQAAALSGLSPRLVYEMCLIGVIRARTVRARWLVHREGFVVWTIRYEGGESHVLFGLQEDPWSDVPRTPAAAPAPVGV